MELQVQELLERIKADGINSAKVEAAAIRARAEEQAKAIVGEAESRAKLREAEAETRIATMEKSAELFSVPYFPDGRKKKFLLVMLLTESI